MAALVDGLLDRLETLDAPDLIDDFAARIPVEVIGNLLDVPHADRGPLRDWSLAILSALEPAPAADVLARGNAAVEAFKRSLEGLVEARRRSRATRTWTCSRGSSKADLTTPSRCRAPTAATASA